MQKKFIVFLFTVTFVLLSTNGFSAYFANYEWGLSKKEVIEKIKKNGHTLEKDVKVAKKYDETVVYQDYLHGHNVLITLFFTPITKQLTGVIIGCRNDDFGKELLPVLKRKYGNPDTGSEGEFAWMKDEFPNIMLYIFDNTSMVMYLSEKYAPIFEKEKTRQEKQK